MTYREHVAAESPEADQAIWRYMDLSKYLSLLHREELYFPRADKLGDPFEGALTPQTIDHVRQQIADIYDDEDTVDQSMEVVRALHDQTRATVYVNSWHMNDRESAAMWELYRKGGEGIAVESTFAGLRSSLESAEEVVDVGKVQYIDYENEDPPIPMGYHISSFLLKRRSYEHERELRAIYTSEEWGGGRLIGVEDNLKEELPEGKYIDIRHDELINRVWVSPVTPRWTYETVKSVTRQYGVSCPVVQSNLNEEPLF